MRKSNNKMQYIYTTTANTNAIEQLSPPHVPSTSCQILKVVCVFKFRKYLRVYYELRFVIYYENTLYDFTFDFMPYSEPFTCIE